MTGAGNGIGRAIAHALVGEGMRTVFADVREDLVAAAVAASPRPELAVTWVGDLASRGALRRFVGCRTITVGQVTHFVHSAAPQRHEADHALAVTTETWERMRAVNVDAGFHLARELARQLIAARQPGSFLMLTSLHAGTPRNLPHYSTAKAALAMLVKELAKTFGRFGIRVNALVPGAIAAGGFVADPSLARYIPLGRLGRSEDLAPMALAERTPPSNRDTFEGRKRSDFAVARDPVCACNGVKSTNLSAGAYDTNDLQCPCRCKTRHDRACARGRETSSSQPPSLADQ